MCNPAKYITGIGFFLRKKGRSDCCILRNEGGFDCGLIGVVFYFFCHQNRRFLRWDGVSLLGPYLARLAWPAKIFMITRKDNKRFEGTI